MTQTYVHMYKEILTFMKCFYIIFLQYIISILINRLILLLHIRNKINKIFLLTAIKNYLQIINLN